VFRLSFTTHESLRQPSPGGSGQTPDPNNKVRTRVFYLTTTAPRCLMNTSHTNRCVATRTLTTSPINGTFNLFIGPSPALKTLIVGGKRPRQQRWECPISAATGLTPQLYAKNR